MKLFSLLFFSFSFFSLSAQELRKVHDGYTLDGVLYHNEWDIIKILDQVPTAREAYLKSQSYSTKAKTYGGIAILSIGLSPILIYSATRGTDPTPLPLVAGIGTGIIGFFSALAALNFTAGAYSQRKKVIKFYNEGNLGCIQEQDRYEYVLKIGASTNGLGFFVAF